MIVQTRVAEYLKNERKELKQGALAERAGITRYRLSTIINCHSEMKADELMQLCNALGVSSDKFIKPRKKE